MSEPVKVHDTFTPWLEQYAQKPQKMRNIVKSHAMNIEKETKQFVPIDTGALHDSIMAEELSFQIGSIVWEIHDGVEYGVYQELGTSRGVPAKHFLGGAAEREEPKFLKDIAKELEE